MLAARSHYNLSTRWRAGSLITGTSQARSLYTLLYVIALALWTLVVCAYTYMSHVGIACGEISLH